MIIAGGQIFKIAASRFVNVSEEELRIGSCLACVYRVMDACGKFGEHERSVRVAPGAAESNSSFLSALQTSQVHPFNNYPAKSRGISSDT